MLIAGGAAMAFERITIDHAKMGRAALHPGPANSGEHGPRAAGRGSHRVRDLADFPDLEAADIPAALEYAAAAV